ncbi:MAG: SUMF1/EgtB/PvdO family nonheme iron enzyme [Magnetococcales bacterium]|nr:SUMF1/EgtB/PvdO family nonheme iron enzyme [Magnetococcales bacterium]
MKYKQGRFDHSGANKRKPQAVRRSGATKVPDKGETSSWRLRITLSHFALPVIFLSALVLGWILLSFIHPREVRNTVPWQACLDSSASGPPYPSLIEIPAGTFSIPRDTPNPSPWVPAGVASVEIKRPFLIQNQKISLEQFRLYADDLGHMQNFTEKQRLRIRLGNHWDLDDAKDALVHHVSYEGALDFAQWLSRRTGCDYSLPSREEWIAAAIYLAAHKPQKTGDDQGSDRLMTSLLRSGREWSRSMCPQGYFLLGKDEHPSAESEKKEICMPAQLTMAGFRLVLNPPSEADGPRLVSGEFLKMDSGHSLRKAGGPP